VGLAAGFFGLDGVGVIGDGGRGDGVNEGEGFFEDDAGAGLASGGAEMLEAMEEGEEDLGGFFDVGLPEPEEEGHEGLLGGMGIGGFGDDLAKVKAAIEDEIEEFAVGIGEISDG